MSCVSLDGRPVARDLMERARDEFQSLEFGPRLAILLIGDDPSSIAYSRSIKRAAHEVGLPVDMVELPETTEQPRAIEAIDELNACEEVAGVIILQPLPTQISRVDLADRLDPAKDIDGITTFNAGRLLHGDRDVLAPSTPAGGMALLKYYDVELRGKHAVVVGRSPVVGKPMALMLLSEDATVTVCHSRSKDLVAHTRSADILVAAAGQPGLISGDMIKPGATVVDFGVNFINGKMVGDVEASSAGEVAGALTPVPGGTGRVTTAVLVRNALKAARLQLEKREIARARR